MSTTPPVLKLSSVDELNFPLEAISSLLLFYPRKLTAILSLLLFCPRKLAVHDSWSGLAVHVAMDMVVVIEDMSKGWWVVSNHLEGRVQNSCRGRNKRKCSTTAVDPLCCGHLGE